MPPGKSYSKKRVNCKVLVKNNKNKIYKFSKTNKMFHFKITLIHNKKIKINFFTRN